ncbi:MAG: FxsA family protein [Methylococcaceae bacterium]
MKPLQILFLLILLIPFAEIYLLLEVGSIIGALPTIFLVISTGFLGVWLLKQQGFATVQRFQQNLARGELPAMELLEGIFILLGGALLLTPGFISDLLGLVCLIPASRKLIINYVLAHQVIQSSGAFGRGFKAEPDVLEGEFRKED